MIQYVIYSLILLSALIGLRYINADCRLEYEGDYPAVPSLLLTETFTLLEPEYDSIRLNFRQPVIVACPGLNNVIEKLNIPYVKAFCAHGKSFDISSKNYQLSELGCKKKVQVECQIISNTCGNTLTGNLVNIGYKISNSMSTLFQICYNYNYKVPLYAHHKIYGASISHAKGSTSRPVFKAGCLPFDQKEIDDSYTQSAQLKKFEEILDSKDLAKRYIVKYKSYLAKGHLNPDGDQVLNTSTTATYLYVNTVPMWQQVNNGNWKSLEISIRNYAKKSADNFEIYTGGHDILKLPDSVGVKKNIYLGDSSKIAVPEYLWKIIYSKRTNSGIGFIALNNPFYINITMNICRNICDEESWGTHLWKNPKRGLLYCCSIQELAQVIPQIPNSLSFSNFITRGYD